MKFDLALPRPLGLLCSLAALVFVGSIEAAEWTTDGGISPRVQFTYTDNICLDSSGQEEGEWIPSFAPSGSISGVGARAQVNFTGSVNFNSLGDRKTCGNGNDAESDYVIPNFRFNAGTELIKNRFFVNANASARQNRTNAFAPGGDDGLNRSGNVNTSYNYSLNPYYTSTLFSSADVYLSYTTDEQRNTDADSDDSSRDQAAFSIGSRPTNGGIIWTVIGNYSDIQYDRELELQPDNELKSVNGTLGYAINRKWQVNGTLGKEWNSFITNDPNDEIDGNSWDVGVIWTPNARTRLDIGTGDRFFGTTPRLDFSYSHRRSVLTASYLKELTYSRSLRAFDDGDDAPGLGPPTTTSQSPILNERFNLAWNFQGRFSSLAVSGGRSLQTRAQDGFEDTFTNAQISFSRSLAANLTPRVALNWQEREGDEARGVAGRDSETWRATFGFSRRIGTRTNMNLLYTYTKRESEFEVDEYTENRVVLSFVFQV